MNFFNNIVNELDIALRTLSDKKTGTERCYPPDPAEKEQISLDSIVISPTKKDDVDDRINGKVTFYDDEKGFGFKIAKDEVKFCGYSVKLCTDLEKALHDLKKVFCSEECSDSKLPPYPKTSKLLIFI